MRLMVIENRIKSAKRTIPVKRLALVEALEKLQSFVCCWFRCKDYATYDHDVISSNQRIHLLSTAVYQILVFKRESPLYRKCYMNFIEALPLCAKNSVFYQIFLSEHMPEVITDGNLFTFSRLLV